MARGFNGVANQNRKKVKELEIKLDALLTLMNTIIDKNGVVITDGYNKHTHTQSDGNETEGVS